MSMIFMVFWDNVLLFFSKIFWNHRHWKLCKWSAEGLEIKCAELVILNLKLKKEWDVNNKLSNVLCKSLQLFIFNILPNLVYCIYIDYSLAPITWFIRHNLINLIGIWLQFFSGHTWGRGGDSFKILCHLQTISGFTHPPPLKWFYSRLPPRFKHFSLLPPAPHPPTLPLHKNFDYTLVPSSCVLQGFILMFLNLTFNFGILI